MIYLKHTLFTLILISISSFAFAAQITPVAPATNVVATAPAQTVSSAPVVQDVYQDGLIATMYMEDAKSGTRASSKKVGVPVGEFVDAKVPVLSFGNIKQEAALWGLYPSAHIGIEWTGFVHAEESGYYVFGIKADKKNNKSYYANSAATNIQLGGKAILKNDFTWKYTDSAMADPYTDTKVTSIKLEPGYYPIKIWAHCGVTKGRWDTWGQQADWMNWTIQIKRPSDRVIGPAPAGTLVWK